MPPRAPRKTPKAANIGEIARLAGVSPATVSRVINTPAIVSDATVERVRAAIERTGYVPNLIAGGLASRRTGLIAIVVPSIVNSIFNDTIEAMTGALAQAGYQVLLALSGYEAQDVGGMLAAILGRRPDGIILTGLAGQPSLRRRLQDTGVPVIETWELTSTPVDMAVGFSHSRIGADMGNFLLARRYKRPFLISADGPRAAARREGLCAVLRKKGLPIPRCHLVPMPSTTRHGRESISAFLDSGGKADVIVCSSDWLALGVIIEARRRGLRIPQDLAVIGFGNLDFAADLDPALTTVHIDGAAIGRRSAELLVLRAQGQTPKQRVIDVGATVIERDSLRKSA
jgi:LacI family transcriptional regulator, gluconate utilization system Gnt-I transcriptional repressor